MVWLVCSRVTCLEPQDLPEDPQMKIMAKTMEAIVVRSSGVAIIIEVRGTNCLEVY